MQSNIAASTFKARALPIHINITHTPPVLDDDGAVTLASTDPGFIGTSTLVRVQRETDSVVEGDADERVHVLLAHVQETGEWKVSRTIAEQSKLAHISLMNLSRTCVRR